MARVRRLRPPVSRLRHLSSPGPGSTVRSAVKHPLDASLRLSVLIAVLVLSRLRAWLCASQYLEGSVSENVRGDRQTQGVFAAAAGFRAELVGELGQPVGAHLSDHNRPVGGWLVRRWDSAWESIIEPPPYLS